MKFLLHQPGAQRERIYGEHTLGCSHLIGFTGSLTLKSSADLTFPLFSPWLSSFVLASSTTPPVVSVKVYDKVTGKRSQAQSQLSIHSCPCPIFLHLSPSLPLWGTGGVISTERPLPCSVKHRVDSVLPRSKRVRSRRTWWQDLRGWRLLHLDQWASGLYSGEVLWDVLCLASLQWGARIIKQRGFNYEHLIIFWVWN